MYKWPLIRHLSSLEYAALVSLPSSTSPRYAPSCDDSLQPSLSSYEYSYDFVNPLTWDDAAASAFDTGTGTVVQPVDTGASTTVATATGADLQSNFSSSPELDFDLAPCFDTAFTTPLFDFSTSSSTTSFHPATTTSASGGSSLLTALPTPGALGVSSATSLSSTTASLTNTPATTTTSDFQLSPSPASQPSPPPEGGTLIPGLKLPSQRTKTSSSRPGRRPGPRPGASLSRTADGRIAKHGHGAAVNVAATPAAVSAAAVAASAVVTSVSAGTGAAALEGDDVDADILDRRYRNNLAAKRYRQKKIDRIEELEKEVKDVKEERDDLRIRLARQEAEVAALREMMKMMRNGNGSGSDSGSKD
ncbi:hypothetical protein B0J18DRAFT_478330 [Chaetomium sp. MPI-SDFR-AT-0129]|nr:hypothetical protein B0J18DRAFT_478330 [Chaetomium sp. MPI-SDFR-AT-0129]